MYQESTTDARTPLGHPVWARRHLVETLGEYMPITTAVEALPWLAPEHEVLRLAGAAQDAVDRLGLGIGATAAPLEVLTRLGVRMLGGLALTRASSPDDTRRRRAAYARQRCDARVASQLAFSLELDRRLHRMSLRDLA